MKTFGSPEALNLAQVSHGIFAVAEGLSFGANSVASKVFLAARLLDSTEPPELGSQVLVLKNLSFWCESSESPDFVSS